MKLFNKEVEFTAGKIAAFDAAMKSGGLTACERRKIYIELNEYIPVDCPNCGEPARIITAATDGIHEDTIFLSCYDCEKKESERKREELEKKILAETETTNTKTIKRLERDGWKISKKRIRGGEYYRAQRTRKNLNQSVHLGPTRKLLDFEKCQKKLEKFEN